MAVSNELVAHDDSSCQKDIGPVGGDLVNPKRAYNIKNNIDNLSNKTKQYNSKTTKRFYVDELGFYRHLDPDQKQYVCSNLVSGNIRVSGSNLTNNELRQQNALGGGGDGGYEICFRAIRRDLGISHFDRVTNYDQWKTSWDNFMRAKLNSSEPVTLNRELKARVRSGIPHDYRCKVWIALIRMRTKTIRAKYGDDIYSRILKYHVTTLEYPENINDDVNNNLNNSTTNNSDNRPNGHSGSSYLRPSTNVERSPPALEPNEQRRMSIESIDISDLVKDKCFKQIELDLLRTLPNNRHFEDPNSRGIQRVRRVLRAYACFNPTVGYCQGMNRLAAMALLVLPEEEAFWCLVAIIQCIMPKDYYLKPWLAQVDCCVLSDLLEKKMPKLHKHLVKNDIQLTLFTWFFTIFVDGFRPELMLRIWDCFLLEGDKVLFRFALSILYISQDDLLEMNDFSTMSSHLSRLVSTRKLDMEHLFESK